MLKCRSSCAYTSVTLSAASQMVDRIISTAELKFSFLFNIVPGLYIDLC